MGRVFGRSAVSAGAMVLAFGGMAVAAPAAAALDCDQGARNGLVTGLIGGLCEVVSGLTGTTKEATDGLTETVGELTETVGGLTGTARDATGVPPSAGENGTADTALHDEVDRAIEDLSGKTGPAERPQARPRPTIPARPGDCPHAPGCAAPPEESLRRETEPPGRHAEDTKRDEPAHEEAERRRTAPLLIEPPRPPARRPHEPNRSEPEVREPDPVDLDAPRADLLWPYAEGPRTPMRVQPGPIKPERSSDIAGTALTAILLLSAILAARIGYARRGRDERIPFEPLSGRSGRHRLA